MSGHGGTAGLILLFLIGAGWSMFLAVASLPGHEPSRSRGLSRYWPAIKMGVVSVGFWLATFIAAVYEKQIQQFWYQLFV